MAVQNDFYGGADRLSHKEIILINLFSSTTFPPRYNFISYTSQLFRKEFERRFNFLFRIRWR